MSEVMSNNMRGQTKNSTSSLKLIAIALAAYVAWVAATYIFEGRINLFQSVDPIGRITYVVVANIAIGIVFTTLVMRYLVKSQFIKPELMGANKSRRKTALVIGTAFVGGLGLFLLQNPRITEPIVVFNAFMQVLPVSVAEVLVYWALIGSSFESLGKRKGKIASILLGAVVASIFFGLYHYAHSPPFNQTNMVLFLMIPSVATAVTYFVGRSIYAAIIVQNFMGIIGVTAGLPDLEPYRQPMIPIYVLSAASVAALIVSLSVVLGRAINTTKHAKRQTCCI
jgi:hypothetical protein